MRRFSYIELRGKYLEFMKDKGHKEIPSASLIPENDPTLLFVNAGMVPLVPFLLGAKHPSGSKLTNSQRCIRTIDINCVGDTTHCTSFEMIGNWSLNDYFRDKALQYTVEFLVNVMGFDIKKLYGSVFGGDKKLNLEIDYQSIEAWQQIFSNYGIKARSGKNERIQLYDMSENWWELPNGGPCGPSSEIFYDTGKPPCGESCHINCECGKYIELGNNVMMSFVKEDDKYNPLGHHNIDFGGGLDRYVMISQQVESVFDTDIYKPILELVKRHSTKESVKSQRIIVDHIKAATWMIMDGIKPGRTERSYILRRVLRRALRHCRQIGLEQNYIQSIAQKCIEQFQPIWPKLEKQQDIILSEIQKEVEKFSRTLERGTKEFEALLEKQNEITGKDAFTLYETYGFPIELTEEMLAEKDQTIDRKEFNKAMEEHKQKSRQGSKNFFKGGLADTSDMSKKYHTVTHLLNAALRQILDDKIYQKGSNITPERLRFDFPFHRKLTEKEISKVENLVNSKIESGLTIHFKEMPKKSALEIVPHAAFLEKYGEKVKVYFIGHKDDPFSIEICGGPHVENTSQLQPIEIYKQENIGSGVRRVKARFTKEK
jgi:alanyl-tRNA synthetase